MRERLITLPKKVDKRGNLSFIEDYQQIPFSIARTYWIYDVPGGQKRGSHAFKNQEEVIFAISGSLDVVLYDGQEERRYHLNRSHIGLYVPNKMWRYLENFSTNTLCLIVSSMPYREDEYIRNLREFKKYIRTEHEEIVISNKKNEHINIIDPYPGHTTTVFDCNLIIKCHKCGETIGILIELRT